MPEANCTCNGASALVFACSGGSNVGQLSNIAAVELDRQGRARMYCLAGVASHIGGMLDSAACADYRIVIDGCAVACARKAMEHAGVQVDRAIVVTDLGIAKNHVFEWTAEQVDRVVAAAAEGTLAQQTTPGERGGCGCGCSEHGDRTA